jgi:hypothetical protein
MTPPPAKNPPPPELVARRDQLLRDIAAAEDAIRTLRESVVEREQGKREMQRVLAGVELALRSVYGWDDPAAARSIPSPPDEGHRRKIPLTEYRDILVPFLREKRAARPVEMRRQVSAAVGFTVKEDALSKAVRLLCADARVPIRRGEDNLYLYDEAKRRPDASPPGR